MGKAREQEFFVAALDYAKRGWQVFPCRAGGKEPAISRSDGGRGHKDATWDPEQIRAWWAAHPDRNIGIRTGAVSGLVVIDVDPHKHGDESMADVIQKHGPLPETITVRTGSGGTHHYFAHPGGFIKSRVNLLPGIDVRGDGGYVLAPPSQTEKPYVWIVPPGRNGVVPLPDWFRDVLRHGPPVPRRELHRQLHELEQTGVHHGARNETLARLVGRWISLGYDEDRIHQVAFAWNTKGIPPLDDWEVSKVVASVLNRARARQSTEDRIRIVVISRCLSPREESLLLGLVQLRRVLGRSALTLAAPNSMLVRYSTVTARGSIREGLQTLQQAGLISLDETSSPRTGRRVRQVTLTGEVAAILEDRDRRRLQALGALHDVELDALALGKIAIAFGQDRRMVDKDVGPTLAGDKAVPFVTVEPLHRTLNPFRHSVCLLRQ